MPPFLNGQSEQISFMILLHGVASLTYPMAVRRRLGHHARNGRTALCSCMNPEGWFKVSCKHRIL